MMEGDLLHICISEKKGIPKKAVKTGILVQHQGLQSDAHAGPGHRQISILDEADIDSMRSKGLTLRPGAFGENLVFSGINLNELGIGTTLRIGESLLELTQIGKVCHDRCAIYSKTGDCIMPRTGIFARVLEGGEISPGMKVKVEKTISRDIFQAAVLTISDTCSSGEAVDTSGPAVSKMLTGTLQANVCFTDILPDEAEIISAALKDMSDRGFDMVVTSGGTGFGPRDVTPEATRTIIERDAPGLAEAMRLASSKITPNAWLQRGICGIRQSTLIVNLPGSKKAAMENLEAILSVIPHALKLLRGETAHHNDERK